MSSQVSRMRGLNYVMEVGNMMSKMIVGSMRFIDVIECKNCHLIVADRGSFLLIPKPYDVNWDYVVTKNMGVLCTKCYKEYEHKFNIEDKNKEHLYLPYWKWREEKQGVYEKVEQDGEKA